MLRIHLNNGTVITITGSQSDICTGKIEIEGARRIEILDDKPEMGIKIINDVNTLPS